MQERYFSLNRYLRETFGEKVYKLALDAGMTCPNRDGTIGTGGCIFCSAGGSGDFAQGRCGSIREQIDKAKLRIRGKTDAGKFIAYFQSYTNTYAPVERLEAIFTEAMEVEEVAVLSVATRPDCLEPEVIALLERLNRIKPVWVELGLQTIHEETARYIRRGYPLEVYDDAVRRLKAAGIGVITHVILGLPGETKEMMLQTIDHLSGGNRPDGVKLQLLHVLEGTDLAIVPFTVVPSLAYAVSTYTPSGASNVYVWLSASPVGMASPVALSTKVIVGEVAFIFTITSAASRFVQPASIAAKVKNNFLIICNF